jgi:hypothetical protein
MESIRTQMLALRKKIEEMGSDLEKWERLAAIVPQQISSAEAA